jgi:hypothetical protein
MARPAPTDLFSHFASVDPDVLAGLDLLARSPPLWPIGAERWSVAVATVRAFAEAWDAKAHGYGWSGVALYRLTALRPVRIWLPWAPHGSAARSGHRVAGIDRDGILLISPNGARVRIYRVTPDEHVAVAWGDADRH